MAGDLVILLGTRKGAFIFHGDEGRTDWRLNGPHFLGCNVHHLVLDPRDGRTLMMATRTGHLGPTVYHSTDWGENWTEAEDPPRFAKKEEGGRTVGHVFWLTPGRAEEPDVWYAGVSPHGIFRSDDGGASWVGLDGFNENPMLKRWIGPIGDQTPGGPLLHSILVDPRDANHLYVGMSGGGVFETADGGESWTPLNRGVAADFLPEDTSEYGHDPHCVVMHPMDPDRLYHQNHCGIYRIDRPDDTWSRIGDNMPGDVGDIGFPMVVHPRNVDTAWVIPMDGSNVWPRTSPGGRPAAYRTTDGGETWERQDNGLPAEQAWLTVYRQGLATDDCDPLGLYFGTSGGELWASGDEGASWNQIAAHLPRIFAVETGRQAE